MRTSLALIVLALAALPAFGGGDAKPADRSAIAKAFVAGQVKGDFAAAMKEFDDVMKKASPADKMEATWKLVQKQVLRVKDAKLTRDTPASELPLGTPAAYWLALRDFRPMEVVAQFRRPILVLQGERDYQVTMADFEGWKKALGARKNVRLKSYPKLNHLFMAGEGKAKPAEYDNARHVAQEVVDYIARWIKEN